MKRAAKNYLLSSTKSAWTDLQRTRDTDHMAGGEYETLNDLSITISQKMFLFFFSLDNLEWTVCRIRITAVIVFLRVSS